MPEERHEDEVLSEVRSDRRAFVRGIVAVTAFTAPMVASYDIESLSSSVAHASTLNSNRVT